VTACLESRRELNRTIVAALYRLLSSLRRIALPIGMMGLIMKVFPKMMASTARADAVGRSCPSRVNTPMVVAQLAAFARVDRLQALRHRLRGAHARVSKR
jgi:hypothetical protein